MKFSVQNSISSGFTWGFFLLVGSLIFLPLDLIGAEPPRWPLDLDARYLTSNFMEYRSGRFHAGIDLKTNTITGFPVRSVEDGYVLRVRTTPFAYGRAIYVRGVSGKTYVYAHLARFNDTLRQRVDAARKISGKYRVRLEFKAGEIPVKKGDVLALSGESGTGGPHLHFEVRDEKQRPLNPHANGFPIPDTMAPVIHSIRILPVATQTSINGQKEAMVIKALDLTHAEGGLKGDIPSLEINGPVVFSAKIVDNSDIRGHKLEPYLISVTVDGAEVFRCCNSSYSFGENSLQRLEWLDVPAQNGVTKIREHWLYTRQENTLPGRVGLPWSGGSGGGVLEPGRHAIVITAQDYAGNETRVSLSVDVGTSTAHEDLPDRNTLGARWIAEPVRVILKADDNGQPTHWLTPFGMGQEPGSGPFPAMLTLDPSQGDPVLSPTLLATIAVAFSPEQEVAAVRQGLTPVGAPMAYLAADWAIDAAVYVPIGMQKKSVTGLMAYRWNKGKWKPEELVLPGDIEGGMKFPLGNPGVYGFFLDEFSPELESVEEPVSVIANSPGEIQGITMPRWQPFALAMEDFGSGVAPETIKTFLDGIAFVVEPDLPRDQILVVLPDDTTPGFHTLTIEVADEMGNLATKEISILVSHK